MRILRVTSGDRVSALHMQWVVTACPHCGNRSSEVEVVDLGQSMIARARCQICGKERDELMTPSPEPIPRWEWMKAIETSRLGWPVYIDDDPPMSDESMGAGLLLCVFDRGGAPSVRLFCFEHGAKLDRAVGPDLYDPGEIHHYRLDTLGAALDALALEANDPTQGEEVSP